MRRMQRTWTAMKPMKTTMTMMVMDQEMGLIEVETTTDGTAEDPEATGGPQGTTGKPAGEPDGTVVPGQMTGKDTVAGMLTGEATMIGTDGEQTDRIKNAGIDCSG